MANGSTAQEIKELLQEEGAIKTPTALRLMLDLQLQQFELMENLTERVNANREGVKELKKWVEDTEKRTADSEKKNAETRRMFLSPLVSVIVTVGTTTLINALVFYFTFYPTYKAIIEQVK